MSINQISDFGQSIWLDYIDRHLIHGGGLQRFIEEDGIRGVTSNPAIFEKAIRTDSEYAGILKALKGNGESSAADFEHIAVGTIREAADVLRPVYDRLQRRDGYVSLEVSPHLANDTEATVEEACRLWHEVDRENLMIKVPATEAGFPAITSLISKGINVNVTLLFSQEMYARASEAYLAGLESLHAQGAPLQGVSSVASFFVSRIDSQVDARVADRLSDTTDEKTRDTLNGVLGKVAVANAKMAYQAYQNMLLTPRWQTLADNGAQPQRLLWASTGTKNKAYSDVLYIEELIGPDTVNTAPPATLENFREHGHARASLEAEVDAAADILAQLDALGISLDQITDELLQDGVKLFEDAYDELLAAIALAH